MRRQRGQSLIEGVLVMLAFFTLLVAIVDLSQLVFAHQALVDRVTSAARWGALHPEAGAENVRTLVLNGSLKPENVIVEFRETDGIAMLHIEIVDFVVPFMAPWGEELSRKFMNARPVTVTVPVS